MDSLRFKTAVLRGLILVASLVPALAGADDYCRIDSKFNVRDMNMKLVDVDLGGRQVCYGSEIVKEYVRDGVKKRGTFRMVKAGGDVLLVAIAAVTVTGPVVAAAPAPVPATKSPAMQLATAGSGSGSTGAPLPTSNYGSGFGGGSSGGAAPVSTSQYTPQNDFAVRKDPKKTGEQIASTGDQPVRVMVAGGKPVIQNNYVQVQIPGVNKATGKPSVNTGYVHQSAFTNLSEPFKPSLADTTSYTGGGGGSIAAAPLTVRPLVPAVNTGVNGVAALPTVKETPQMPTMSLLSEGQAEKPGQVALENGAPVEGTGVTTLPPQLQVQSLTETPAPTPAPANEAQPDVALNNETAAVTEGPSVDEPAPQTTLPDPVIPQATTPQPAIAPIPVTPMALGDNQFFRHVPAKNWATAKSALNLRDKPGTGTDSKVLMQIKAGGRFAVAGMEEVAGKKWFKVVPFDCDDLTAETGSNATCNQVFWVSGEHVRQAATPSAAEITGRMAWGQTEATIACTECDVTKIQGLEGFNDIADVSQFIEAAAAEGSLDTGVASDEGLDVYEDYLAVRAGFMKGSIKAEFDAATRTSTKKAVAAKYREAFIKYIKDHMSEARANAVILALTAYGEARNESVGGENQRKTEMAMVLQTIINRRNFEEGKNNLMHYALANWQFSVWNRAPHTDINLFEMMNAGGSDSSKRILKRAFETYAQLQSGAIKPLGDMAKSRTRHYYAPGASPGWRNDGRKIDAQFQMPDGSVMTVKSHKVRYGVA